MPTVYLNLVGQSVSGTPGTGTITLGAALPGLRALAATVDGITCDGETFDVTLIGGANASVERDCLYNSTAGTLARGTVESSTTGSRLSLTSAATVRVVAAASRIAGWGAGGGGYEVATFADLPAAGSVTVGRVYTVLAAVCTGGVSGTQWVSNGSLWGPARRQMIYHSTTLVDGASGGSTAEQFLLSLLLSAGVLQGVREFGVRARWLYSAADPNNRTCRWRIGTSGTASDAIFSQAATASPASRHHVQTQVCAVVNATSLRPYAQSVLHPAVSPDNTFSLGSAASDLTVASLSSAVYLSATVQQGATPASTASLSLAAIYVE